MPLRETDALQEKDDCGATSLLHTEDYIILPYYHIACPAFLHMQVIDNSSAFRMTEGVPLVIPEVNPNAMKGMRYGQGGIIANPNCSTIIALMAVTPLHRAAKVRRL